MVLKKEDKEILKFLVEKEIENIQDEEADIIFPKLNFIKSVKIYEEKLKQIKKDLS
jgi:hypothetical protein